MFTKQCTTYSQVYLPTAITPKPIDNLSVAIYEKQDIEYDF